MAEAENGNENGTREWEWPEVIAELFTNTEFLKMAHGAIDAYRQTGRDRNDVERERLAFEKQRLSAWSLVNRHVIWSRTLLSVLTIGALSGGAWYGLMPTEVIAALMTAVVGSLFVQPRQQ